MKVFCALITMIGRSGLSFLTRGNEIEGVLVGHQHVGDDEIAVALADPPPQGRGIAGGARRVAGAGERLVEDGADRCVVVGDENIAFGH